MSAGFWLLTGVACLLAIQHWRTGFYAIILLTLLQDPVRKLTPGAPSVIFLGVISVLVVTWLSFLVTQPGWWRSFRVANPLVSWSMLVFALACVPAIHISYAYGEASWLLALFGVTAYGLILAALVMGFHFARRLQDIRSLLVFYSLLSLPMLVGGYLDYLDLWPDSKVLGTEALEMSWLRVDGYNGTLVYLIAGFYRSPDVMGWHAATVVMLSWLLWSTSEDRHRWLWVAVGVVALGGLLLCGRRKMVYMVPLFAVLVPVLSMPAGQYKVLAFRLVLIILVLSVLIVSLPMMGKNINQLHYYFSQPEDIAIQLHRHAVSSVITTYQQSGFLGQGMGTATPGSQHLPTERPRLWQESGPSRVMVELGVLGFTALLALILVLLGYGMRSVRRCLVDDRRAARYAVSLLALFIVNLGSLLVSGQILADPFVSAFLGLIMGLVLSLGRLQESASLSRLAA